MIKWNQYQKNTIIKLDYSHFNNKLNIILMVNLNKDKLLGHITK